VEADVSAVVVTVDSLVQSGLEPTVEPTGLSRWWFSSTDAGACERALANEWKTEIPMDYAPIGAESAVQAGYKITGMIHGHHYQALPLVPTLRTALDHPKMFRVEDFVDTEPFA
jgi:hypothetical protein